MNMRRRALRYEVRVQASLSTTMQEESLDLLPRPPVVLCHTKNLSEDGLSLIVPALRIESADLTDLRCTLRVMLALPVGYVELYGLLIHYRRLRENESETGFLIGLKIEQMSDPDRLLYKDYLRSLPAPDAPDQPPF